MKAYKVVSGVLQVGAGLSVGLMSAQAASRVGMVAPIEGERGVYRAEVPLMFKAGEIIGLEDPAALGKVQADRIVEASEEDLEALAQREEAAVALARKAKAAAKEKAKSLSDQKSAVAAAREDGRKVGYAEGFKVGRAEGDKAGHARGVADEKAASAAVAAEAQAKAWSAEYAASDELKARFKTAADYIDDRRKAAPLV